MGAPKAAYVLQTGDFIRLNLSTLQSVLVQADNAGLRKMYKSLIEFFPGSHELLPGDAFFRDVSAYAEAGWDINGNGVGSEDYTYEEFTSLLDGLFRSTQGPQHARSMTKQGKTIGISTVAAFSIFT